MGSGRVEQTKPKDLGVNTASSLVLGVKSAFQTDLCVIYMKPVKNGGI